MKNGDKVYYLYTDKNGVPIKFAAIIIRLDDDGIVVRVGRYDVHSKEVSTFESTVSAASLQPRAVPCSYEDELLNQV